MDFWDLSKEELANHYSLQKQFSDNVNKAKIAAENYDGPNYYFSCELSGIEPVRRELYEREYIEYEMFKK